MTMVRAANNNKKSSACIGIPADVMHHLKLKIGDNVEWYIEPQDTVSAKIIVKYRMSDFGKGNQWR